MSWASRCDFPTMARAYCEYGDAASTPSGIPDQDVHGAPWIAAGMLRHGQKWAHLMTGTWGPGL